MTKIELDMELARLLKEVERRRGLGGYSADAHGLFDLYGTLAQITLHLIHIERKLNKRPRKK